MEPLTETIFLQVTNLPEIVIVKVRRDDTHLFRPEIFETGAVAGRPCANHNALAE
jgi:hypothetical protein